MHAVSDHTDPNPYALTFARAVELCALVGDDMPYEACHAVVLADADNEIIEQTLLEGSFTLDHAAGWALGFHHACSAPSVVLMSVVERCVECIDPISFWDYERLVGTFRSGGVELRDWLLDDGYVIRSMAYTARPESAWLTDPLVVRTRRLELADPGLVGPQHTDVA